MRALMMAALAAALMACDDTTSSAHSAAGDGGPGGGAGSGGAGLGGSLGGTGGTGSGGPGLGGSTGGSAGGAVVPAEPPAFVRLSLDPRQTVYSRTEHPTVVAEVLDAYGEPVQGPLTWSIVPAGRGLVDASASPPALSFLEEGEGAVRACATPDLCGRATFFVDDGPPLLVLDHPAPGEVLSGEPVVHVSGSASGAGARVFVNDAEVPLDPMGAFAVDLPAHFGFNRVEVLADDGVQRPAPREIREAVYAPRWLPVGADGIDVHETLAIRISQGLLDSGIAPPPPDADGVVTVGDIAGLLEAVLARLDPLSLLGNPVLAQGEPLDLTVLGVSPGEPDVSLAFTESGLEVFLRLRNLTVTTQGTLMLEGVPVSLTGDLRVTAAAFARLAIEAAPGAAGEPVLRLESADVAIEGLSGRMDDPTAQAVLNTFGSLLRTVLEEYARTTVDELIRTQVPEFISLGLGDTLAPLADMPIDFAGDDIIPPFHLRASFRLATPVAVPRAHLTLGLGGRLRTAEPTEPPHPDPGLADDEIGGGQEPGEAEPPWPAQADAAVAVRLRAVNAALHCLWRAGVLNIDATGAIPEELRALLTSARIDARLPPLVVATPPGAPALFELQVGEVDLLAQGGRNPAPDLYTLSIRIGLVLHAEPGRLRFELAGEPDLRAVLRQAGGDRAFLPADALAQVLRNLAWAKLQEALGAGLEVPLDDIHFAADTLGALSAGLTDIQLVPIFPPDPALPRVRHGWFVLPLGLEARLR